jgi:DNA-binding CsgD family transcriptional regulator
MGSAPSFANDPTWCFPTSACRECPDVTKPIDFDVLEAIINTRLARGARSAPWPNDVNLSNREIETLTWAARGKTSAEIAQILGRTKRTIDFHLDNARAKLGVANRTQAVMKAVRDRLIKP